ncbi:hypothetical protein C8R44DRAFT_873739 [Mycena epipterygia]|nr:hypothetical protein C8R44DRAFT_873739 [Mycena epipterygia]
MELCVDTSVTHSPELLHAMEKFAETLQKIESFVRTQQDMGRLKRFFRRQVNAAQLEDCKMGLEQVLNAFAPRARAGAGKTLDLEITGNLSKTIVKHLAVKSFPILLVLDNFKTPWEPIPTRSKMDAFLSVLADLPNIAILVKMRGQERPLNIRWTRPFVSALKPLSRAAAHKTFIDISDADSDEDAAHVPELLALTGNLLLAVTLMATVASSEGCKSVLLRWRTENVTLLSEGFNKETNLEISLRLSLSTPRMTSSPGGLQLLSLLSLLPGGISDVDLLNSSCPISELSRCKSTLLRTPPSRRGD